ncbi:hypothetical protein FHG87_009128 [Trinorchestia longiramus]|nr:hypothetical protein FHG87_009128 [Trinorchestia longiramus]
MLDPTQEPEFFVSQSSEHYRLQNYRPEWESNPCLSQWLAPGRNSKRARCTYCDIEMTADICVLKSHGKGSRHKRRLMGENLTSNSRYNPAWERDPDYADWVRPGRIKTRAECLFCDVEFAAETTVLKNHAKSKRHGRAACQAKKLAEMSRVWSAEKLLVDRRSTEDSHGSSTTLNPENRRGSFPRRKVLALPSETPQMCTLTVDERSCSSEGREIHFDLEDRITSNSVELRTTDSEPEIDITKVTSENKRVLNVDASSAAENLCTTEPILRVRNAHLLGSPNTLVMTIEDSNSCTSGNFDSCANILSEARKTYVGDQDVDAGDQDVDAGDGNVDVGEQDVDVKNLVGLGIPCRSCQGSLYEDGDGRRLCAACDIVYTEHGEWLHGEWLHDSPRSWLPCKKEEEQDLPEGSMASPAGVSGAAGDAEEEGLHVMSSVIRPAATHRSSTT